MESKAKGRAIIVSAVFFVVLNFSNMFARFPSMLFFWRPLKRWDRRKHGRRRCRLSRRQHRLDDRSPQQIKQQPVKFPSPQKTGRHLVREICCSGRGHKRQRSVRVPRRYPAQTNTVDKGPTPMYRSSPTRKGGALCVALCRGKISPETAESPTLGPTEIPGTTLPQEAARDTTKRHGRIAFDPKRPTMVVDV